MAFYFSRVNYIQKIDSCISNQNIEYQKMSEKYQKNQPASLDQNTIGNPIINVTWVPCDNQTLDKFFFYNPNK